MKRFLLGAMAMSAVLLAASPAGAAAGDLDVTFGDQGVAHLDPTEFIGAENVLALPDGGAIVIGSGGEWPWDLVVTRLDRHGAVDPSFGASGYFRHPDAESSDAALLPDGSIVLLNLDGMMKLAPDGNLDPSFGENGEVLLSDIPHFNLAVLPSGGFITAADYRVARLHADGTLDTSFGSSGVADIRGATPTYPGVPGLERFQDCRYGQDCVGWISDVGVASDQGVVAVGALTPDHRTDHSDALVAWGLTADGAPDPAFGDNGRQVVAAPPGYDSAASELEWVPDGSLRIAGWLQEAPAFDGFGIIVALERDGKLRASYGQEGITTTPFDRSYNPHLAVGENGSAYLMMTQLTGTGAWKVVRFDPHGAVDPTFGDLGVFTRDTANSDALRDGALTSGGRLVVVGRDSRETPAAARLIADPTAGCTVLGTEARDVLRGTSGPDVICGFGDDDMIFGNGGNDILWGGEGDDHLHSKDGVKTEDTDFLIGEGGVDTCTSDESDRIFTCP